jgi:hypothetical protein
MQQCCKHIKLSNKNKPGWAICLRLTFEWLIYDVLKLVLLDDVIEEIKGKNRLVLFLIL